MTVTARITISDTAAPTPYIDPATGEWMVYDDSRGDYVSTGIKAKGEKGDPGEGTQFLGEAKSLGYDGGVQLATGKYIYGKTGDTVRMTNTGSNNITSWIKDKVYILVDITNSNGYVIKTWTMLSGKDGAPGRDGRDGKDGKDGVGADYSKEIRELESGLSSAKTSISALKKAKEEIEKGKLSASDLPAHLKWIYDAFNQGEVLQEGGLLLSQIIGLFNIDGKITAYISGRNAKGAHMLAAGVTGFGTSNEHANVYLNHDGDFYLSKDDTFLKFDPDGRFALTLFGGKLNIPGVLYAGLYNRTILRSISDTIPADYAYGQLKVVADARKAAKQDYCDFFLFPIGTTAKEEKDGYTDGYALTHNAGTKNYVPIVIGFDRMKVTKVDENHFEFIYHQERTAHLRSIWIVILGENRADYGV